jgi:hypothetical protein
MESDCMREGFWPMEQDEDDAAMMLLHPRNQNELGFFQVSRFGRCCWRVVLVHPKKFLVGTFCGIKNGFYIKQTTNWPIHQPYKLTRMRDDI